MSKTTFPELSLSVRLAEELAAITEAGLYESEEAFLADAVLNFLTARPDLREAIACKLYEKGVFSLGRAAAWSGLDIDAMKEALHRWGIDRQGFESVAEIEAMARKTLKAAGRTAQ